MHGTVNHRFISNVIRHGRYKYSFFVFVDADKKKYRKL